MNVTTVDRDIARARWMYPRKCNKLQPHTTYRRGTAHDTPHLYGQSACILTQVGASLTTQSHSESAPPHTHQGANVQSTSSGVKLLPTQGSAARDAVGVTRITLHGPSHRLCTWACRLSTQTCVETVGPDRVLSPMPPPPSRAISSPARTKHTRPHLRAQGRDGTHICTPDHLLTFIATSPRPPVDFASERNHVELVQEVVGDEDEVEREENQADALGKAEAREERDQIDSDKRADEDDR